MGHRGPSAISSRMGKIHQRVRRHSLYGRFLCRIVFIKRDTLPIAKRELNLLLEDSEIHGIPMLIIGNKIDINGSMKQLDIIQGKSLTKDSI